MAILSVFLWLSVSSGSPSEIRPVESHGGACDYTDLRPSPEGCAYFLQCANGQEFNMPCQDGHDGLPLFFDFQRQWCDERQLVACEEEGVPGDTTSNPTTSTTVTSATTSKTT